MPSLLAWPRVLTFVLALSFWAHSVHGWEESLFASSVTYCNPPETLLVQRFDVAFFPRNTSVVFNVSASSVEKDVNVTANLFVNVYGMKPFNITLDFCHILNGALCPLPMYNFTGADDITIPGSLDIASYIPSIAFKIPDLEGYAQLSLTEISTGKVKACIQATISNGWSARQKAVEWTTAGIALGGLLAAVAFSIFAPDAIIPVRLLELMSLFQVIASSGLLDLNYPSVYRAFTLNFSWALGLFPTSAESRFQQSINHMRHLTGGELPDADGSAEGLVNRKYSPFNAMAVLKASVVRLVYGELGNGSNLQRRATSGSTIRDGDVQTITAESDLVLQPGVPIYVNYINIGTANAFMTTFLIGLILLGLTLVVLAVGYVITREVKRRKGVTGYASVDDYRSFAVAWLLRVAIVSSLPVLIFIFYQWTLKDSWLSIFLSVIASLIISTSIVYPSVRIVLFARRESPQELYHPSNVTRRRFGPLYAQYRPERYWFFIPIAASLFLRAVVIAFARYSAPTQIALILALELGLVIAHFALKPVNPKGSHIFTTYIAVTRLVCTGLLLPFVQTVLVKPIPRVVVGCVIAIIWIVAVLFSIFNLLWNIALYAFHKGDDLDTASLSQGSAGSMLEKGSGPGSGSLKTPSEIGSLEKSTSRDSASMSNQNARRISDPSGIPLPPSPSSSNIDSDDSNVDTASSSRTRSRPVNPTPEQMTRNSVTLDPSVLQPYPISPTGTTVSTMEDIPSIYSRLSSGSMTVGSLLSRRWSITMSAPGTPGTPMSFSSHGHSSMGGYAATASESGHGNGSRSGSVSRNTSLKLDQTHQHRFEDIEEDAEVEVSSRITGS